MPSTGRRAGAGGRNAGRGVEGDAERANREHEAASERASRARGQRTRRRHDEAGDRYVVRRFRRADRDDFLALHARVFGGGGEAWFAWKYEENPYVSEAPIFVAEADGAVVGARPFLAFRMRVGDGVCVALQTGDTMVHPDHRRRGLFTRMTEQAFEYYADHEPAFTFNVPNQLSRPGYLKLGCEPVGALATYYRVQDPAAFLDAGGPAGAVGRLSSVLGRAYTGVRDRLVDVPGEVSVTRHVDVPAGTLASLYGRRPPEAVHALRDEQFYEYRLANPEWEYAAYTARLGGEPVAGLVAGTRTVDGRTVTNLADVVPLVGDAERDRALSALLARVLADHADADVVAFRGTAIPESLLSRFAFHSDRRLPLSAVTTPTVLVACPLPVDGGWRLQGRDLRDRANWSPTFLEQNTS